MAKCLEDYSRIGESNKYQKITNISKGKYSYRSRYWSKLLTLLSSMLLPWIPYQHFKHS